MKKVIFAILAVVFAMSAKAQTVSVALNIGPLGYNCGLHNTSYICNGLPVVTIDTNNNLTYGTLWTDDYAAKFGNQGFVNFYTVPITNAKILYLSDAASATDTTRYLVEHISGQGYTGVLTIHYYEYYSRGGGGRVCGGCGYHWVALPDSTLEITYL